MSPPIYLDHASTSRPKAPGVAEAMASAVHGELGTPGRGSHLPAAAAASLLARLRERLAVVVGVRDPSRIILTSGATESLNLAVLGLLANRTDRPRVVTTILEHNALRRPLRHLAQAGRIELTVVAADASATVDARAILRAINERTVLVAMTSASNVTGAIQPVDAVAEELAVRRRASHTSAPLFLVDASQTAGLVPINAELTGIDLVAFSGHKALGGPAGTGVLYVGPRAYDPQKTEDSPLRPARWGGTGRDSDSPDMPAALPDRYEPGTPNLPGFAGLLASVDPWSQTIGAEHLHAVRGLHARLRQRILECTADRVDLWGAVSDGGVGVLSLRLRDQSPDETAIALESLGVLSRAGLHCAPGAHEVIGTLRSGGTVRLSVGHTNTPNEIDAAADAVAALASSTR